MSGDRDEFYKNRWIMALLGAAIVGIAVLTAANAFSLRRSAQQWKLSNLTELSALVAEQADLRLNQLIPEAAEDEEAAKEQLFCLAEREEGIALLRLDHFGEDGVAFLLDQKGELLLGPSDISSYNPLVSLVQEDTGKKTAAALSIRNGMAAGQSGVAGFEQETGNPVLVAYTKLDHFDWYLITIVREDKLNMAIQSHINRNTGIVIISFLLFGLVLMLLDYNQRSHARMMERQIFVDPLTGGMSNARFVLEAARAVAKKPENSYLMLSVDIREFRVINDICGPRKGDDVLLYLYRRLKESLKEGELLTRGRADVFYMLLHREPDGKMDERLEAMTARLSLSGEEFQMELNLDLDVGVCEIQDRKADISALQGRADIARKTKQVDRKGNILYFSQVEQERRKRERELLSIMDASLKNGEFVVYLQPKVALKEQRVMGAEALIRWKNPLRGFIYPNEFIPVFEKNGLLPKLDLFVFEEVCRILESWKREGKELPVVSLNFSRQHLLRRNFPQELLDILARYDVEPSYLELEVTESSAFQDMEVVRHVIDRIHEAGFGCSIDDFGAGYSSLGVLRNVEADVLKMDRSFFASDGQWDRGRSVVRTVVELTKRLHIKSVAEGIETEEQLSFLREVGCDVIQGYVFSRPLPVEEFTAYAFEDGRLRRVAAGVAGRE